MAYGTVRVGRGVAAVVCCGAGGVGVDGGAVAVFV